MQHRLFLLFFSLFLLFPQFAQANVASFLKPQITAATKQLVCFDAAKKNCQVVFTISGNRFLNSQDSGSVRVGGAQATILRWTDSVVSASAPSNLYDMTPVLKVDTTITLPTLNTANTTLNDIFNASVQTALDDVHIANNGQRYLSAGPKYDDIERTYYRDSYWLSQLMLLIEPYVVRDEIVLLAGGVKRDGSTPSAITINANDPSLALWDNHFDSGPYLVMMVDEYVRATGDTAVLNEKISGVSLYQILGRAMKHLKTTDSDADGLPEKPKDSLQDWLDTIPRGGEVLYDEALYFQALTNMKELATILHLTTDATSYKNLATNVRTAINTQFWSPVRGYYYERCESTGCVDRLTNESSLAILYGIPMVDNRKTLFESLKALESRQNTDQHYGDWGVINAWPLYAGSSSNDYGYQNGADWPFLDAMNAGARLLYHNDDWEYPLTRWWTYLQEQNRNPSALPEYVSPVDASNGTSQAWSVAPIMSAIKYGLGLNPDLNGFYTLRTPPWGATTGSNFLVHGKRVAF